MQKLLYLNSSCLFMTLNFVDDDMIRNNDKIICRWFLGSDSDFYEATQCVDMINFIQGNGMIPIYGKKKLNMWKNKRSGKDIEWENRRMDISHYSALAVKDSGLRTDANNVQQLCRW